MSTTVVHAGIMVLPAYSLAANGCCPQYADASYKDIGICQKLKLYIIMQLTYIIKKEKVQCKLFDPFQSEA